MTTASASSSSSPLWVKMVAIGLPTGFALFLYWVCAAPALTWANHGADGGDLLAAAVVKGVPHPSGYPLYTLLLRGWLALGARIDPLLESAYWGNRLSALFVAGAVSFTVAATATLLRDHAYRWLWAALAALAFAITPLAWSQATITEVYALHALLVAALGWAILSLVAQNDASPTKTSSRARRLGLEPRQWIDLAIGCLIGVAAAHHLTSILLWPAIITWRLERLPRQSWLGALARMILAALLVALPLYASQLWRVNAADEALPVAWGYPRDLSDLWWLVSGAPYRAYVFDMTPAEYLGRLAALARLLVEQFTPIGMILVVLGLAVWDRQRPLLRNGALLWLLPISLYAAGYNTVDSYIYLLPVVWLLCVMLGQGLASGSEWISARVSTAPGGIVLVFALIAIGGASLLLAMRFPQMDLRMDHAAQDFLNSAATTLEAESLVISSADAATFALWYGEWGSNFAGESFLASAVPNLVLVNYSLYQFGWYRDLMHDLYPEVPKMGAPFAEFLAANRSIRPILFTDQIPEAPETELVPAGIFWRLKIP